MKSLLLAVVVTIISLSSAFAHSGSKGNQPQPTEIKIVRDWK